MKFGYRKNTFYLATARPQNFGGGQTFLEYMVLISIVIMIVFTISPLMRRTTQSMVRLVADQIGNQKDADQDGGESGYLESAHVRGRFDQQRTVSERMGSIQTDYLDVVESTSNQVSNLGYAEY